MTAFSKQLSVYHGSTDAPPGSSELDIATALLKGATNARMVDSAVDLIWAAVDQALAESTTRRAELLLDEADAIRAKLRAALKAQRKVARAATAPSRAELHAARTAAGNLKGSQRIAAMNSALAGEPIRGTVQ